MLTRMTMMRMETVQLRITLMNQHTQCIQLGSPISFISSCGTTDKILILHITTF